MEILITICGRGGSKGVKNKNIRPLNGKPLIYYSINHAIEFSKSFSNVTIAVSSDDNKIITLANKYGIETEYIRPNKLATDKIGKVNVIKDLLFYQEKKKNSKYDIILDLDISSPLRTASDLINGFKMLIKNKEAINLFSVSNPNRNPYFNVVELKTDGYCKLIKNSNVKSRQQAPTVFDMNASFYFYKRIFFSNNYQTVITGKSLCFLMDHICFDIDHEIDFDIMNYLIKNNKLDFKL